MPLYEYECSACKRRFELLKKFSDEPAQVCIHCGGPAVRLLSSPAIQFKGTGWYVTDYAAKSAPACNGGKDGPGKDDAKPAASSAVTPPAKESGAAADKPAKT